MERFGTWDDLVGHVRAGWPVFYQAPLDVQAVKVQAKVVRDGEGIHVTPPSNDADPFVADRDHLRRFCYNYRAGGRDHGE